MYQALREAIESDDRKAGAIAGLANMREETLSRTLDGFRKLKFDEAIALAKAIGKPFQMLFPEVAELIITEEALQFEDERMNANA
jgi:hypothetical protein